MASATLRAVTLGCKVNQYETEYVRQGLTQIGYRDAREGERADLCLVNTCTVTAEADAKSRQVIRRLARQNPGTRIVVMGCYATCAQEEVARLPGVVEVVTDKRELPDLLGRFGVIDIPEGISHFGTRHRAYVKVQDGCILRCAFCVIPMVRPGLRSRAAEAILEEIQRLVANGYHEIVLTGIHLGHYGVEWNRGRPKAEWMRLSHLLREIVRLPGEFRVRLSSIEATELTRELLEVMASHPRRICPHLHVSMQSGSDAVLRRMRRRWGAQRFADRCHLAKEMLDAPAMTTDVIVGFPGEGDDDFEATCRLVAEIGFSKVHIFPFSPRKGTPAFDMADQLPKQVKSERARHLASVERELRQRYFRSLTGRRLEVLAESPLEDQPGWAVGTSGRYTPVELPCEDGQFGKLIPVVAGQVTGGRIRAAGCNDR